MSIRRNSPLMKYRDHEVQRQWMTDEHENKLSDIRGQKRGYCLLQLAEMIKSKPMPATNAKWRILASQSIQNPRWLAGSLALDYTVC